ncbi:MAG: hypothetical protein ABI639_06975 [Thermoanaerobaculia bacterium]
MLTRTYRGVTWIAPDGATAIPLTRPEQRDLDTRSLLAQGRKLASELGLDEDGRLEVVPIVHPESFEVPEVMALRRVHDSAQSGAGVDLPAEECQLMTVELAEGRARMVRALVVGGEFTHVVERTHNLDDTLLPFNLVYHARLT